eukprot:gnl/TRDRNA2_/TRDRNA2_87313_c0_seq1.p1 gnl/TRDRNA2_/TRDRNA2_87313_c0~~gnl/TRDRNA2_/TRDRNA2_87313_c0_seq1.p1  ORF type:complete len:119 (-),score=0.74 gnl/TRDRNA2_/TRDRNA2_87313_c0_seq1:93-449(-)
MEPAALFEPFFSQLFRCHSMQAYTTDEQLTKKSCLRCLSCLAPWCLSVTLGCRLSLYLVSVRLRAVVSVLGTRLHSGTPRTTAVVLSPFVFVCVSSWACAFLVLKLVVSDRVDFQVLY